MPAPLALPMAAAILAFALLSAPAAAEEEGAQLVYPEYEDAKVVFDFYLDDPAKMAVALYWIRSLMNPLMAEPYGQSPEFMSLKVVVHGTEIVTVAKKNYEKYRDEVERMRYYAQLGVEFKVCGIAAHDYGYRPEDFYEFIDVVPSAMTELVHWQQQGHALLVPTVMDKRFSIEEIR
jgi:intracellular sulfur oxidation DsrE/DsrF family protein